MLFTKDHQYFKLDIFDNNNDFAILEVEPTIENQLISIPDNLSIIGEVTNNPYYQNSALAVNMNNGMVKSIQA